MPIEFAFSVRVLCKVQGTRHGKANTNTPRERRKAQIQERADKNLRFFGVETMQLVVDNVLQLVKGLVAISNGDKLPLGSGDGNRVDGLNRDRRVGKVDKDLDPVRVVNGLLLDGRGRGGSCDLGGLGGNSG